MRIKNAETVNFTLIKLLTNMMYLPYAWSLAMKKTTMATFLKKLNTVQELLLAC